MCDHSCRHVDPYNRIPAQHEEGLTKCRCPMGECVEVKQKPVAEQVHMPKACEHSKPLSLPTLKLTKQVQTEISKPIKSTTGGNNLHSLLAGANIALILCQTLGGRFTHFQVTDRPLPHAVYLCVAYCSKFLSSCLASLPPS